MNHEYHALIYDNRATNKVAQMMNGVITPEWDGPVPSAGTGF